MTVCDSSLLHTACVCGSEKNYRLQDIQLSKNSPRARSAKQAAIFVDELATLARLPNLAITRSLSQVKAGGEYRARTGDLLVANQALSQLS